MTASPAPRIPFTRSAADRIADASRRIDTARTYRRVCSMAKGAKFDHAEPIGPAAAPFEIGQRVRFTADIGTPELVHVTGEIVVAGPSESVVRPDIAIPGYSAELRSFNTYIEPLPEGLGFAEVDAWTGDLITEPAAAYSPERRIRDAREYRAELSAYGVPVEALLYAEPAGPAEAPTKAQREAAEYAAALRTLADIVEAVPQVHRYNDFYAWYGSSRGDLADVTRAALAAGARVEKDIDESSYNVELRIGPLKVSALASRRNVCERVVLGTDVVTKTVPDPEYVAPEVPTVEVTETVDRIEWRCVPLLADNPAGATASS